MPNDNDSFDEMDDEETLSGIANDEILNVAIIGTGGISESALTPAIMESSRVRLHAIVSRDLNRAGSFAAKFKADDEEDAVRVFDSLDACLSDNELDAVVIATPDKMHAEQTIAAAEAGMSVLVEKPMATSVAEAESMVKACDDAGVTLAVAYHARWHRGHRKLAQMVHAGDFGEIRHARAQWTFQAPDAGNWRAHDELGHWWSLAATGTHCVDWISWMLEPACGELVDVSSVISRDVLGSAHDETASISLLYSSGATAQLTSSVLFNAPGRCEIYGSSGYAVGVGTLGRGGGGEIITGDGALEFRESNPFVGEINDFADAVVTGREPEVSGEEGLRNVEILIRAYT